MKLKQKFFQTLQSIIAISHYLESEIDYKPFIIFIEWCLKKFQVNLPNLKAWWWFCDSPYYNNISVGAKVG